MRYRVATDSRGKITSGKKSDRGYPQSLNHFNITEFPELIKGYGEKPNKLVVFFPSDTITDFFDCNYVLYGKDTKIRSCDSEECIHRIKEDINGSHYEAGECSECVCKDMPDRIEKDGKEVPNPKKCKYTMYLKAFIADPQLRKVNNPLCYLFYTGSQNSGDNIYSEIEKIQALNMGVLRGVPFILEVEMVGGKEDAKMKFPIWKIHAVGMIDEIRERTEYMLDVPERKKSIEQKTGTTKVIDPENPLGLP